MINQSESPETGDASREPFSVVEGMPSGAFIRYAANPVLEVKFRLDEPAEVEKLVDLLNSLHILAESLQRLNEARVSQVDKFIRKESKVAKAFRRHLLAVTETLSFHRDAGLAVKFPRANEVFDLLVSTTDELKSEISRQNEKAE